MILTEGKRDDVSQTFPFIVSVEASKSKHYFLLPSVLLLNSTCLHERKMFCVVLNLFWGSIHFSFSSVLQFFVKIRKCYGCKRLKTQVISSRQQNCGLLKELLSYIYQIMCFYLKFCKENVNLMVWINRNKHKKHIVWRIKVHRFTLELVMILSF